MYLPYFDRWYTYLLWPSKIDINQIPSFSITFRSICHSSLGDLLSNRMYFLFFLGLARRLLFNLLLHEILIRSYVQPLCYIVRKSFPCILLVTLLVFLLNWITFCSIFLSALWIVCSLLKSSFSPSNPSFL